MEKLLRENRHLVLSPETKEEKVTDAYLRATWSSLSETRRLVLLLALNTLGLLKE